MNIVLVGTMGSGKDTVAEYICNNHRFIPIKLGIHIRENVDKMFSHIPKDQRRPYYQQYGEGMREIFGEYIWNKLAYESKMAYEIGYDEIDKHIVVDARQPHDIKFWMEKGFTLVCVEASDENRELRLRARDGVNFNPETLNHYTELRAKEIINSVKAGDLPGYIINNDGIPEARNVQIEHIMQILKAESKGQLV